MNLTIIAIGTTGDVLPLVGLGCGLARAGHVVTVAAPLNFERAVIDQGLQYRPIRADFRHIFDEPAGRALLNGEFKVWELLRNLRDLAVPLAERVLDDIAAACQGCDAVLYSLLSFPAKLLAEDAGIPSFACLFQPLWRTGAFPSPVMPISISLGALPNRLTHLAVEQAFWQLFRPIIQRWRSRNRKSPVSIAGPFGGIFRGRHPVLCAFSPSIVPPAADLAAAVRVTGFWSPEPMKHWCPPDSLVDFLAAGPAPICVGFGSMKVPRIHALLETILEALQRRSERVVLLAGWSDVAKDYCAPRDNLYVAENLPHDWLFPRVSAVIHHGGAGTTAAALRHGRPSIVVPFFFDQAFWARRLAALGAGVGPIRPEAVSLDTFTSAINALRADPNLRRNAIDLGRALDAEDGVGNAVEIIERHCLREKQSGAMISPPGNLKLI